jgi:hypothetical protein
MRLPTQKKILREDLKDSPQWAGVIIDTLNSFMETVYQGFNRNLTFSENIACFTKELTYRTPSTYPVMDDVEFLSSLKTKATGIFLMQALDKSTYEPVLAAVYVPWIEINGTIVIKPIQGLAADKTYLIRLLVT